MIKTLITAAAALAMFTVGLGMAGSASAGGGAPYVVTKSKPAVTAQNKNRVRSAQHSGTEITEFSSSSARHHPGR